MTLDSELAALDREVEANLNHAETLTQGLSARQFNWRPAPGQWSMGECFAHLNIVNGGGLEPLRAAVADGHANNVNGVGPFRYGILSRKFVASMEPPAKRKFKAPQAYLPPSDADPGTTMAEFRRIGGELRKLVQGAQGLDLARVKTSLPALPAFLRSFVRMPLGARFGLFTAHDRRHIWQAQQVRDQPDFPKD
jgi:hypothetical protein